MAHNPPILVVDENDEPIGAVEKDKAQREGLIHRISNVMVEDPDGRLLLQKRADNSPIFPGAWDASVGGHVDDGENYLQAAEREMLEEIGLKGVKLQEVGKFRDDSKYSWRRLNRFYTLYKVVVPADTKFKPEPDEVSELRWFSISEIKTGLESEPENFTNVVAEVMDRYYS